MATSPQPVCTACPRAAITVGASPPLVRRHDAAQRKANGAVPAAGQAAQEGRLDGASTGAKASSGGAAARDRDRAETHADAEPWATPRNSESDVRGPFLTPPPAAQRPPRFRPDARVVRLPFVQGPVAAASADPRRSAGAGPSPGTEAAAGVGAGDEERGRRKRRRARKGRGPHSRSTTSYGSLDFPGTPPVDGNEDDEDDDDDGGVAEMVPAAPARTTVPPGEAAARVASASFPGPGGTSWVVHAELRL